MNLKKILLVSGTHGNEINPIWAVNLFNQQDNANDRNIVYKSIIGNPLAFEKGVRYIDTDLNRSFDFIKNLDKTNYEIKRAKLLKLNIEKNAELSLLNSSLELEINNSKKKIAEI